MSPRSRTAVKVVFYLLIAGAFGFFIATVDWGSLDGVTVNVAGLVLATAVALAFRYLGVLVWRTVLTRLGAASLPRFTILADVYAKAWLARYIPGTIPWIAGKIYLAAEHGISKSRLAVSSLVEAAAQVVGVGVFSLALLAANGRLADVAPAWRGLVVIGAIVLATAILPPVFNRLLSLMFRLIRRGTPVTVGWGVVGVSVALYALGALVSGVSYAIFTQSFVPGLSAADMVYLTGAFGLAGIVGMLTPLVPSGLGTRDGAQMLLLLVVLDAPTAALVVLMSRLWSALVDVLFWAVALLSRAAGSPRGQRA